MATNKRLSFGTGLAVAAVLLLGITVFANRIVNDLSLARFDFTQDKIYTVSSGAKNILARLDVPVQIKYYVTPKDEMPAGLKTLQQEVTDKLAELEIASKGMLDWQVVNPKETPELEEQLSTKGVRPFQVQSVDRDALAVKLVYSAMTIGYKDKGEEAMPQILPENMGSFEYELISKVMKLTRTEEPIVAVYSAKAQLDPQMISMYLQAGQPLPEAPDNFRRVPEILRSEGYDCRTIQLTKDSAIPESTKTLIVLAPQELDDRQKYEIARFLRGGGNVIIAAQTTMYDYLPGPRGGFRIDVKTQPLAVNDLLTNWGIRIDDRLLMDHQMATLAIPRTQQVGFMSFQVTEPVQAPMQVRVMGDGVVRDLPITAGVPEVLYLWGNQLVLDDAALSSKSLATQTILQGSDQTWLIEKPSGSLEQTDIVPEGHDITKNPKLAVLVQGTFPDPWEGKPVPGWSGETDTTAVAAAPAPVSPAPGRLVVVGCSKMFEEMLLEQAGHAMLLLNTVDALTLGDDLISIRSKRFDRRTFGEVSDGKKLLFRVANVVFLPATLVAFGLMRSLKRRREKEEYAAKRAALAGGAGR
jgi:ABC-type uncharacterized transport system involved in gliding motility auxiliary subunit